MRIRYGEVEDLEVLTDLWLQYYRDQGSSILDYCVDLGASRERIRNFLSTVLQDERMRLLVAEEGREVIGFLILDTALLSELFSLRYRVGEVVALGVAREWRRRGVGSQLLRSALEYLRRCGCQYVLAEVLEENKPSLNLFRKLGFTLDHRVQVLVRKV